MNGDNMFFPRVRSNVAHAPRTHQRTFMFWHTVLLPGITLGALVVMTLALNTSPLPLRLNIPLLAHVSGLLAGYGITVMLGLMSRAPVLEHTLGADNLARWHAMGGRLIILVTTIHAVAATQVWITSVRQSVPTGLLWLLGLPGLFTATVGTVLLVGVALVSARSVRHKLSYEQWHAVHLATYVAVALAFSHQLAGPDIAGHRVVQILWSLLYCYSFFLVLRYRFLAPVHQMFRHRLRVHEVISEAPGVVSIIMHGQHLDELSAESGQFFRWRFLTSGTWTSAHPFSLSAPPQNGALRITVKALGEGSRRLQTLHPGTYVLAEGPYGAMTEQRRTQSSVLLVAGGVGITPMRALFETMDVPGERLTLLYRSSKDADVLFRAELDEIARCRGARVIYLTGSSSEPANALTSERLDELVPNLCHHDVYLCASPGLSQAMRTALFGAGLPHQQLHEEVFSF